MRLSKLYLGALLAFGLIFTGCSGGTESNETVTTTSDDDINTTFVDAISTGVFIDSAVEGLRYITSSGITGITNSNGEYQFKDGDSVEFFLGNVSIGSMVASELLSVFHTQFSSEVAMILQSIDSDGNPNNGITIDSDTQARFENTDLIISEVSSEDEAFKIKFKEITGKDFVITEFDAIGHAEASLALEMLSDREFYNYYIGDIDVYSNASQYNGIELAASSSKRMNLYYFNYAILPQLQAEAIKYKYNIDSTVDRHEENVKLVASANDMISEVLAAKDSLSNPITINIDEVYTIKDLAKELTPDIRDKILEIALPNAIIEAKATMIEGDIIPREVVEFVFRELELIGECKEFFAKGGAANCYQALGTATLGILNDGYSSWVLAGEVTEWNTNTIIQTYLSDYFNFAADYNSIYSKYGVSNIDDVLITIANAGKMESYADLTEIKNKITDYQMKVYTGTDRLIEKFDLQSNMSTSENTNLDVSIVDGTTKLVSDGSGGATLSTSYEIRNNSLYQIENSTIVLSVIPKDEAEVILSTQTNYTFSKLDTEKMNVDLAIDATTYTQITASPYVLKLSVTYDGKTTTDSKVLESSLQNEIYDLIVAVAPPQINISIPENIYSEETITLDATGTTSLIVGDTISYAWEFLSTDKVSGLVLSNETTSQMTFDAPTIPDAQLNLELVFKLTATSNTNGESSTEEFVLNVASITNTLPISNSQSVTVQQDSSNNSITLSASDVDAIDTLTYTVVTEPTNGILSGTAPDLTYTPTPGYSGADSFTFKVNDGTVDSAIATINITVNEAMVLISKVTNFYPTTVMQNEATTFTVTGENLPTTIALSLQGSSSCETVQHISATSASIVCTPSTTGTVDFYVAQEPLGIIIDSDVSLKVVVEPAPVISVCDMYADNHTLASLLFNLDLTIASYDNPGFVTAEYLMEPYDNLISGVLAHPGTDFRSKNVTEPGLDEVYSLTTGTVVRAENGEGYGIVAVATVNDFFQDIVVFYGHLNSTILNIGDPVEVGTFIGLTGNMGTTDPHLHVEYRVNYTGTSMVYNTSCGSTECTTVQIEELTNNPIDLLSLHCQDVIPLPTITLTDVVSIYQNEEASFEATVAESLDVKYTLKIRLGDGAGGYLDAQDMLADVSRLSFTYSAVISVTGDRLYQVGLFEGDIQVGSWADGTYTVMEEITTDTSDYIEVNDLISGTIDYRNDFGEQLDIPSDMWVRVVPSILQNDIYGWDGPLCKVDSSGSFGSLCYVYDEVKVRDAFADSSETYQVVVYKNYINTDEYDWNCGEDLYKYVGDGLDATSWNNIVVMTADYQDRSSEVCSEIEASSLVVLKTGQTTVYTTNDDGTYQTGATRSYTRDDLNNIVTDNITGLIWQDDSDTATVTKQWVTQENYDADIYDDTSGDTAATYCSDLTLGSFTDWRLPSRSELVSLNDYGRSSPAIDPVFQNTISNYYWSSTTDASDTSGAWYVFFYDGGQGYSTKANNTYIRCVRAGQ